MGKEGCAIRLFVGSERECAPRHVEVAFGSGWAFSEHARVTVEILVSFNKREAIESEDQ
jgi:hypothetical protein